MKGEIMAYVAPNSTVHLLHDIRVTPNYSDTIYFANRNLQEAYFTSKVVHTLTKQSYTRHGRGYIKVKLTAGQVSGCNYLMFKNTSFENKWFYAFITDWEYINNNTTGIFFEIDAIQTWFYDCSLGTGYVEREHAMTDVIGQNRLPEPVGTDRFVMNQRWELSDMEHYSVIVQASQQNRDSHFETDYLHQGQFNGLSIWVSDCDDGSDASVIAAVLDDMVGDGSYSDNATEQQQVVSVIMFPTKFTVDGTRAHSVNEGFQANRTMVDGYTPRNKKLLSAPFKSLLLSNGIGASVHLDYDDFISASGVSQQPAFHVFGTFNGAGQLMCVPYNYKRVEDNFEYKVTISNFPQCGYTLDSYRAWLAGGGDIKQQVGVVQGVGNGLFSLFGMAQSANKAYGQQWNENYAQRFDERTAGKNLNQGALNAVDVGASNYANKNTSWGGAIAGGAIAGVGGLASSVLNTYSDYKMTQYQSQAQPNIPVGMTAGNVMLGARKLNFRCYDVDVNQFDARLIDEFFDRYGYATERVKVPNISGRKCWNYVKTRDCELVGNIPASIKAQIIDIFNNGITFWKNGDQLGDYSLDNTL